MPVRADRPYSQFNFWVNLNDGNKETELVAGFQEVSSIGMEVAVAEYRTGNDAFNSTRKITGLNKASDVTLKRGVIGAMTLYKWLDDIRQGKQDANTVRRDVTITLLSEDKKPILEWRLMNARIIKYSVAALNAKGNDVAMEEMVLSYERLEMKERND